MYECPSSGMHLPLSDLRFEDNGMTKVSYLCNNCREKKDKEIRLKILERGLMP